MQQLLHRRIRVFVPPLKEVNAQHHIDWKQRTTGLNHWGATQNHSNKPHMGNNAIHLLQKNSPTRFLDGELETIIGKDTLFHPSTLLYQ
jgi:hypothetical protein